MFGYSCADIFSSVTGSRGAGSLREPLCVSGVVAPLPEENGDQLLHSGT